MPQQFRYGENDIFFTTLKTLARFSPRRVVYDMCVFKKKVYHLLLHCDTHNDFLKHGILTSPNGLDISIQRRWELTDKPSDTPNGQQTMEKWCSKVDSKAWDLWALKLWQVQFETYVLEVVRTILKELGVMAMLVCWSAANWSHRCMCYMYNWNQLEGTGWIKTERITLLRVIPTVTFLRFLTGKSSGILSDISSGILSGKSSGILSGISSGILSDISSGILSGISSGIYSDISSGILSGISHEVRQGTLGVDTRGWGPAGNTGRGWSWLRSGREHWAGILAVEVRQGTLGVDGRGWGPAGNTGRGWSWLRSGREHWAWMVVVEVRQRTLSPRVAVEQEDEDEEEAGGGRRRKEAEGGRRQLT